MNWGRRNEDVIIWICVAIAVLLLLAAIGYLSGRWEILA